MIRSTFKPDFVELFAEVIHFSGISADKNKDILDKLLDKNKDYFSENKEEFENLQRQLDLWIKFYRIAEEMEAITKVEFEREMAEKAKRIRKEKAEAKKGKSEAKKDK